MARSQDLGSAVALAVALLALMLLAQGMFVTLVDAARYFLGHTSEMAFGQVTMQTVAARAGYFIARSVLPFMLVMLVTGLATNLMQVGLLFTAKPLQPKLNRINPLSGFQRFASVRTLMELVKSVAKITVVIALVWMAMRNRIEEFVLLMALTPQALLPAVASLVVAIWWRIAVAMFVLGLVDLAFQRWQHERELRMTRKEAEQETKELEGDPHVKRRIRQVQRQLAMQRMMREVPEAEVIVTNPTTYAVALRYAPQTMAAPVVIAKGMRLVAERIREIGQQNNVPIVQNPELARTLYRTLDVGQPIPEVLFQAVAEVLSYVYSIDRRAEKMRERAALRRAV